MVPLAQYSLCLPTSKAVLYSSLPHSARLRPKTEYPTDLQKYNDTVCVLYPDLTAESLVVEAQMLDL